MCMKMLIRRLTGVTAIVLLSLLALPQPAQACYACEQILVCSYFGGFWCWYTFECRDQGFPCSNCYSGCIEGFDTCSHVLPACQFASKPLEPNPDRLAGVFALPVAP